MVLDLRRMGCLNEKIYIIVNPQLPPYIIHSKSYEWSKVLIEKLLSNYRIYKPIRSIATEIKSPFILVCGDGFTIYVPGRWNDKFRGGIFRYTLVKSIMSGLLDGPKIREVDISISNISNRFLEALMTNINPIIILSGDDVIEETLLSLGLRVVYPDNVMRGLKLYRYLNRKYGISNSNYSILHSKIYVSFNGRRLSISLGAYSEEDAISIVVDGGGLDGVNHVLYNPRDMTLHIRLTT